MSQIWALLSLIFLLLPGTYGVPLVNKQSLLDSNLGIRSVRSIASYANFWPHNRPIPFVFGPGMPIMQMKNIKYGLEEFRKHTCLKFVELEPGPHLLGLQILWYNHSKSCDSPVGMQPEGQAIHDTGCGVGGAIHETMHSLGFIHESQRPDRDQHIKIFKENVDAGQLLEIRPIKTPNLPYDCLSLMHHSSTGGSTKGLTTISTCTDSLGTSHAPNGGYSFSRCDLAKINHLYKCPGHEVFQSRDCTPGVNYQMELPEYADEASFCSNKNVKEQKLCEKEPGKYSTVCRKTCNNRNGGCSNTNDFNLHQQHCQSIPDKYEAFEAGFKCNEVQKIYCPGSCLIC